MGFNSLADTLPISDPTAAMPSLNGVIYDAGGLLPGGSPRSTNDVLGMVEREFLQLKSKVLPAGLAVAFPLNGPKRELGSTIKGSAESKNSTNDEMQHKTNVYVYSSNIGMQHVARVKNTDFAKDVIGFMSQYQDGFAAPTRYAVLITPPDKISNQVRQYDRLVSMSCKEATLPERAFATTEDRRGKPNIIKMPYDMIYDDVTFTFYLSNNMKERIFFEEWMNAMYDKKTNSFEYYDNYISEVKVMKLDFSNSIVRTYILHEVYPVSLGDVSLSYDAESSFSTFTVTFTYKDWTVE